MTKIPDHTKPAIYDPDLVIKSGNIYAYVEMSKPNGRSIPTVRIVRVLSLFYRTNDGEDHELLSVMLSIYNKDDLGCIGADIVEIEINQYSDGVINELKAESVKNSAQTINGYALTRLVEIGA